MSDEQEFIDYYAVLHVEPDCDAKVLEKAYRHFAQLYHPDHAETADVDKFQQVNDAYKVLRDSQRRAEYDRTHAVKTAGTTGPFTYRVETRLDEAKALNDATAHERILLFLYKRRRENARDAGVIGYYLQEMLGCSDETYDFHVWYLRQKGFIEMTEHGTVAITIEGVDQVIAMSRAAEAERLLIAQRKGEG